MSSIDNEAGGPTEHLDALSIEPASNACDIRRGVMRLLLRSGEMPVVELTLPNGRRADVAALGRNGTILIVEIKSSFADFRSDQKWPEYRPFCDLLYFAVAREFPSGILPPDCGLILADRYGAEIVRDAPAHGALAPARRRAMTLRMARIAAARLAAQLDPSLADLLNRAEE